jgi:prepilin-type N-terminal cleavage/methylation domain-containing protein/prepilin-type processing-associated H-X9-DG protein
MFGKKRRGFTLVELLVAVSVIAVLMAILMPVLAAACSQARSAVCRSNIRQLVLANIGYSTENDGFFVPAARDMWSGPGYHRWHGVRDSLDEPFEPLRGPLVRYLADGKVKECPERVEFVKGQGWAVNFEQGCGGYGYNMAYLGSRLWQSGYSFGDAESYARTTLVSEVARPSETLMFADTAFYQQSKYLIEYSFAEPRYWVSDGQVLTNSFPQPSIHFRHKGRANVGWADGHSGSREMGDFYGDNECYADFASMNLGWFEPIDNSLFDLK